MSYSSWLAFLLVSLATTFSPGPGVLLAISSALTLGPRRALLSSAGNALGVLLVASVAVSGLGLLLQTSAIAFAALKMTGAGYLIYLGVRVWRSTSAQLPPAAFAPAVVATTSRRSLFLRGLLVAVTNPKSILFFSAIFPQFMQSGRPDPSRFLLLTTCFVACVLLSHLFYIVLVARLGSSMLSAARMRVIKRASGLIFIGLGCALLSMRPT